MQLPAELEPYAAAIMAASKPAALFRAIDEGAGVYQSRFGGRPAFPRNSSWPKTAEGKAMDFVFQINLAEVLAAAPELRSALPSEGMLQFFCDMQALPFANEDKDCWSFRFQSRLESLAVEPRTDEPSVLKKESVLKFSGKIDTFPGYLEVEDVLIDEDFDPELDDSVGDAYAEMAWQPQGKNVPWQWVLGCSSPIQDSCLIGEGEGKRLLLQFDSDTEAKDICFLHQGRLYFLIDEEDLAAGRLDQVELQMDCY